MQEMGRRGGGEQSEGPMTRSEERRRERGREKKLGECYHRRRSMRFQKIPGTSFHRTLCAYSSHVSPKTLWSSTSSMCNLLWVLRSAYEILTSQKAMRQKMRTCIALNLQIENKMSPEPSALPTQVGGMGIAKWKYDGDSQHSGIQLPGASATKVEPTRVSQTPV